MIKKILITLISLAAVLIVALTIFLLTFDLNHYREFVQNKLSKALNYPVQIGSMRTKLSLIPTIQISNFKILQNGENPKVIVDVPLVEATVELVPLLKKKIEIQKINVLLVSADLTLLSSEKTEPTKNNKEANKKINGNLVDQLWVSEITVDKLLCRYMNKDKKEAIELNKFSLKDMNKFKFKVDYQKKTFDIDGSSGLLTKIILEQKMLPIDLKIKQGSATVTLKGQIGDISTLSKIRINANITVSKLATFLKSWNITVPKLMDVNISSKFSLDGNLKKMTIKDFDTDINKKELILKISGQANNLDKQPTFSMNLDLILNQSDFAKKLSLKPFEMTADTDITTTKATIKNINFRAGRSDITGKFDIQWQNILTLEPNLTSSYLALNDVLDNEAKVNSKVPASPKAVQAKTTNANEKINWAALNGFNLKGKIDIANLFLTYQITDYISLTLTPKLEKGHLTSDIKGGIIGGQFKGDLDIDANKKSLAINLTGQHLNLDRIRSIDQTIKGAQANTKFVLKTQGDTVKNLTANANGQIAMELIGGTILDKWFNSLPSAINIAKQKSGLLDFSTSDQKTDIMCGAINVPIKNGVITSDEKIVLQTNALNFMANGQINLKNETLDMTVIPSVNQTRGMANQLLTTVQSVHFKGPWTDIKTSVDVEQAINSMAQATIQKLSGQKPSIITSNEMCQSVLDKSGLTISKPKTKPQVQNTQTTTKQPVSKKENLKQQLMQSITEALNKGSKK